MSNPEKRQDERLSEVMSALAEKSGVDPNQYTPEKIAEKRERENQIKEKNKEGWKRLYLLFKESEDKKWFWKKMIPEKMKNDRDFNLGLVKYDPSLISFISEKFQSDIDFLRLLDDWTPSERISTDPERYLPLLTSSNENWLEVWEKVPGKLKEDKMFLLKAIEKNHFIFHCLDEKWKKDRQIYMKFLKDN